MAVAGRYEEVSCSHYLAGKELTSFGGKVNERSGTGDWRRGGGGVGRKGKTRKLHDAPPPTLRAVHFG